MPRRNTALATTHGAAPASPERCGAFPARPPPEPGLGHHHLLFRTLFAAFRSSSGQYLMSWSYLRAGAVRAGGTDLGGRRQTPRAEERVMVSRVAVGFHAPRTGLGFLFSLISQSPLKFHISCYEIWHTSGFFSLLPDLLSAFSEPFRPASRSASCWKGWYPLHHSLLMVCWELAVLSTPSAPSRCC